MADKDNTLLGRPIQGTIDWYSERNIAEQYSPEKFLEMIDAVFATDPNITALGWVQYTPYFNDGDACTFSAYSENALAYHEVPVSVGPESFTFADGEEEYAYDVVEDDSRIRSVHSLRPPGAYGYEKGVTGDQRWAWIQNDPNAEVNPTYTAAHAFYSALNGGNFDNVVLQAFGDPGEVIATREGFIREHYDHD